jgi:WD40 repeat protein
MRAAAGAPQSATLSPDAKLVAGAYGNGQVQVWDSASAHPAGPALRAGTGQAGTGRAGTGLRDAAPAVAFSPDGKLLAGVYADGSVRVWDPAAGPPDGQVLQASSGSAARVTAVAFGPGGKLVAGYADGTIRLWSVPAAQSGGLSSGTWFMLAAIAVAAIVAVGAVITVRREIRLRS